MSKEIKISGFTIIRNAEIMGYPVIESIKSALPLVDEFIVGVGESEDKTKQLIQSINDDKIKIFDAHWDSSKTKGGRILSDKTNEALEHCSGDWALYIQSDEILHEDDYKNITGAMHKYKDDPDVEGLLFDYHHFYGAYNIIATARNWYRREVRVIKLNSGVRSAGDAQGFRTKNRKPKVKLANARIFHYGWVQKPNNMKMKRKYALKWYTESDEKVPEEYTYRMIFGLKPYNGDHPAIMKKRIREQDWETKIRLKLSDWKIRDWRNLLSNIIEKVTGLRIREHKNYVLLQEI